MGELLVGTTLLVSFLGGMVALLAPCCVSVMVCAAGPPAETATSPTPRRATHAPAPAAQAC